MSELYNAWTGHLVRLCAVEPGDWERFAAFDQDSEGQRLGYYVPLPRSAHRAQQWAKEQAERQSDPAQADNYGWAIEAIAGGEGVAGHLNVHGADRLNANFEYGINLGPEHRGKGYAADALKILLRQYFDELRYHRVSGIVYAFNEPSQRFHEKFGFALEGRLREYHYSAGQLHDVLWYGMTAPQFWALYPELRTGPHPGVYPPPQVPSTEGAD